MHLFPFMYSAVYAVIAYIYAKIIIIIIIIIIPMNGCRYNGLVNKNPRTITKHWRGDFAITLAQTCYMVDVLVADFPIEIYNVTCMHFCLTWLAGSRDSGRDSRSADCLHEGQQYQAQRSHIEEAGNHSVRATRYR